MDNPETIANIRHNTEGITKYGQFRDIVNIRHKTQNETSKTVCKTYKTKTMSSTYPTNQAKQSTELLFFI
jgi:hypothetical protein